MNSYFANLAQRSSLMPTQKLQRDGGILTNSQKDLVTQTIEQMAPPTSVSILEPIPPITQYEKWQHPVVTPETRFSTFITPNADDALAAKNETQSSALKTAKENISDKQAAIPSLYKQVSDVFVTIAPVIGKLHTKGKVPLQQDGDALDTSSAVLPVITSPVTGKPQAKEKLTLLQHGDALDIHAASFQVNVKNQHEMIQTSGIENVKKENQYGQKHTSSALRQVQVEKAINEKAIHNQSEVSQTESAATQKGRLAAVEMQPIVPLRANMHLPREPQINIRIGTIELAVHQLPPKVLAPSKLIQTSPTQPMVTNVSNLHRHYLRDW